MSVSEPATRAILSFCLLLLLAGLPACGPEHQPEARAGAPSAALSGAPDGVGERRYPPSGYPDRVILTWDDDAAETQTVTWRTDGSGSLPVAQLVPASGVPPVLEGDSLDFDVEEPFLPPATPPIAVRRFEATTREVVWDGATDFYHSVRFTDLEPDTPYLYRVGDGTRWSEWHPFRTAAADGAPLRFLYLGDAQNNIREYFPRTIRQALRHAPDVRLIVYAGDLTLSSGSDDSWGDWFLAGGFHLASIPSLPSTGNSDHLRLEDGALDGDEIDTRMLFPQWHAAFTLPANGPAGMEGVTYFQDVQGVRFVHLYSNWVSVDPGDRRVFLSPDREVTGELVEAQRAWLEETLRDNPNRWTVVTFHHPVHSVREDRENETLREMWKPLFERYGVDLVLQGHDHAYGRGGGADGGPVYVISNAGGKARPLDPTGVALEWTDHRAENLQAYQVIEVDGDRLVFEAFTADGRRFDHFELERGAEGRNRPIQGGASRTAGAGPP